MHSIAAAAGMTSAGLYRHFADKEAMFTALVQPLLSRLDEVYNSLKEKDYAALENNDLDAMWQNGREIACLLDLIYSYYDEFKLLICCSAGTRHENFIHDFVMLEQRETLNFLEAAKDRGITVNEILPQELHMLMSAYVNAIFEIVIHDFTEEEARHYIKTLQKFFYPGWRTVLGL